MVRPRRPSDAPVMAGVSGRVHERPQRASTGRWWLARRWHVACSGGCMRSSHRLCSRLLVLCATFGPLAGCPVNSNVPDTETDATGGTTGTTGGAPTTSSASEVISTTVDPTTSGTTVDPSGGSTSTGESTGGTTTATTGDDSVCDCINPGPVGAGSVTCASDCGTLTPDCEPIVGDTDTDTGGGSGGDCEFHDRRGHAGLRDRRPDRQRRRREVDLLVGHGLLGVQRVRAGVPGSGRTHALVEQGRPRHRGLQRRRRAAQVRRVFPGLQGRARPSPTSHDCLLDWSDEEPAAQCDGPDMATDF